MHQDEGKADSPRGEVGSDWDLSFAAFSLMHAGCVEGVIELRLGEQSLLVWCLSCAVLETFGPLDR